MDEPSPSTPVWLVGSLKLIGYNNERVALTHETGQDPEWERYGVNGGYCINLAVCRIQILNAILLHERHRKPGIHGNSQGH